MVEKSRWRERWSEEERAKEREIEKQDIERVLTKKKHLNLLDENIDKLG